MNQVLNVTHPSSMIDETLRCLIVHNFYQRRGGEEVVFETETAMLRKAGYTVETFTIHNDALASKSKLETLAITFWNPATYRALQQRIERLKPHIVHFHNTFPSMSPSVLHAAHRSGAAVVMTLHNFRMLCPSANLFRDGVICTDCLPRKVKWPAVLHKCYRGSRAASGTVAGLAAFQQIAGSLRAVDRFITPSEAAREQFLRAGFPADRVSVKPNAIPQPSQPLSRQPREKFALFVGRLVPEKGVLTMLEAWRRPEAPKIPLVIVGEGPLSGTAESGGDLFKVMGRLAPADVQALMLRASLLIFPSEWYEPFGLTIIEAWANGLPVLAAKIGAAGKLIEPGVTGDTFEAGSADALAKAASRLMAAPELLDEMSERARDRYSRGFSADANLKQLAAIYRDALSDKGSNYRTAPLPA